MATGLEQTSRLIENFENSQIGICAYEECGKPVISRQEHITLNGGEVFHTDCYCEASRVTEAHPIGAARLGGHGSAGLDDNLVNSQR